jgi:aspartyl-tRNA(Asn)/glutamyl-tRNA(Gln) amidotransferase subunit A
MLTLPFNLTGWAAASVPGQVADGELPVGVQVVGCGWRSAGCCGCGGPGALIA